MQECKGNSSKFTNKLFTVYTECISQPYLLWVALISLDTDKNRNFESRMTSSWLIILALWPLDELKFIEELPKYRNGRPLS